MFISLWFLGSGIFIILGIGFLAGRVFQGWASARSEYAKMKAEFDEQAIRVKQYLAKAREEI